MAKQLDEFPENAGRGRPDKYDWTTWFNGKPWELEAGTDFDVNLAVESFRATAKSAAKKRGGTLRAAKLDDKRIVLQFVPNP